MESTEHLATEESLALLKQAESLCYGSKEHEALLATTLNNLACVFRRTGQRHEALRCLEHALFVEASCDTDITSDIASEWCGCC